MTTVARPPESGREAQHSGLAYDDARLATAPVQDSRHRMNGRASDAEPQRNKTETQLCWFHKSHSPFRLKDATPARNVTPMTHGPS